MTEKRFNFVGGYLYDGNKPLGHVEDVKFRQDYEDIVNALYDENEQLKKQLNDITLNWTQNRLEFDKDELYVKDNNTEITLKSRNLFIQVFIPQIEEYFRFNYVVTGRNFEREYNTLKGDDGKMTEKRDYSLCIDCRHQRGTWVSDRDVDTWCAIKRGIDCDEIFECDDFMGYD